jgi:riboflavin kinase/FMN adenylyltransferase
MQILSSIPELAVVPGPVHVAIGFFDGVHAGHQAVIAQACAEAESESGGTAVVATFDPHPLKFLRPAETPRLLTSTRHKALILKRLGISHLLVIPFDAAMAALEPEEFIRRMASACRPLASITVGREWAFGRGRTGNLTTLQQLGERFGFKARGVAPVTADGEAVSSTRIRAAVERGDFSTAALLLARDYSVLGTVMHGRHLGNQIGFPTANLALEAEQLPPLGVYAVRALVQGALHDGVANLGHRPTVDTDSSERHLEVHLFDFAEDIYGDTMEVRFVQRLREERKFESLDALRAQISRDAAQAREVLADGIRSSGFPLP